MLENFRKTKTVFSMIEYHFVFCPRYRRKVFLMDGVAARFKELVHQICEQNNYDIIEISCGADYCCLHVAVPPVISAHDVMKTIKPATSNALINEFSKLSRSQSIWTRNFLVSTYPVSEKMIEKFVLMQKKRGDERQEKKMREEKRVCGKCRYFLGMGDWNLCCDKNPDLYYEDTPACETFKRREN